MPISKAPLSTVDLAHTPCFQSALAQSRQLAEAYHLRSIFEQSLGGYAGHSFAGSEDDRQGTDVWVHRKCGRDLSIDLKLRSVDPLQAYGRDDVLVELFSVIERDIEGWSLDEAKATDYVYWLFPTGRFVMAPFAPLCLAVRRHRVNWIRTYRAIETFTPKAGGYRSQCVAVPTQVLLDATNEITVGGSKEHRMPVLFSRTPALERSIAA